MEWSAPEAIDAELAGVRQDLRAALIDLLLYRALFQNGAFARLADLHDAAPVRAALLSLAASASAEASRTVEALRGWNGVPAELEDVRERLRVALLSDLLAIKEGSAEALLLVGMRAPTNELRMMLVDLADADRQHADALREVLGTHKVGPRARTDLDGIADGAVGAHPRRASGASLGQTIQDVIDAMRADGQDLARLTLSPLALRHARDEGVVDPDDGTMFGLTVVVDFGWRGECFAVHTRDHASLAEIITSARGRRSPR